MSIIGFTEAELNALTERVEEWLTANSSKIEEEIDKSPYSLYSCIATADTIRMSLAWADNSETSRNSAYQRIASGKE